MDRLDQQQNAIFSDEEVGLMPHEIQHVAIVHKIHLLNGPLIQSTQPAPTTGPQLPEGGLPEGGRWNSGNTTAAMARLAA